MKTKKITYIALLSAVALIFGYIESLFPVFIAVPGIKLGLSNIVILFALYRLDKPSAFFIMLIKVTVLSLLFSGLNVFFYSLCGGFLSLFAMIIFKRINLSTVGISITGGIFHNLGQLLAASIMLKTASVFYYLPVLLISGLIVGFITGMVCKLVLKNLKALKF